MTARPGAGGGVGALGLVLLSCALALGAEPMPAEIRVRSTPVPLPTTTITVRAAPGTAIDDRTVGARPAAPGQGMASLGDTFRDDIQLFLRGLVTSRPAAIEVADDLVSMVRVSPEAAGTTVVVFVRQPVTYTVTRPSAAGDIVVTLKGRPAPPRGRARRAAPGVPDDEQVAIDAEELTYDQERDVMVARGDVTITRGVVTLRADEVRYDRPSGIAEAEGNVVLTDPESTVEGTSARIDLNDESGWMESADAEFLRSGYTLRSGRVEKGIGPRYRIDDGLFTTCKCGGLEKPSWSVGGKRTEVELNGIGVVRGATFRVKDVPVFWAPILAFPALTDRASGFLMPRFAYSDRRGFQYEQPFFWNISKSQDATFALDVETSARIGLLAEYRYALSKTARGTFAGGYWNESFRSAQADDVRTTQLPQPEPPFNRWLVLGHAKQPLAERRQLYLDVFTISDDTLLADIDNFTATLDSGLRLRSARLTKSRAGGVETWNRGLWQAEAVYYQDLIDPQELAPQRAPFLRAEQGYPVLGNRLVARLGGQVTNFQRAEGFDGFRGDVSPELFLPFQLGRVLQGSVTGRVHGTMYQLGDDQQVAYVVPNPATGRVPNFRAVDDPDVLPLLDPSHFRGIAQVRARLGTEIARVYDFQRFGLTRLRHSIEPELRYLYVPDVDQELYRVEICRDPASGAVRQCRNIAFASAAQREANLLRTLFSRGYLFDELDAINRRNFVSYGLAMRLLGRVGGGVVAAPTAAPDPDEEAEEDEALGATPPLVIPAGPTREFLRVHARHGIDPTRDINLGSHLANLDLGLRAWPLTFLRLAYNASFDVAAGQLAAQNASLGLVEPNWVPPARNPFQSPASLRVSYRFVEQNVNAREDGFLFGDFANAGVQNVTGALYLRLGNHAGFAFGALYDLNSGTIFENDVPREVGPHFILREYLFRFISPCNCWAAEFGVTDDFRNDERLFRFQITLLGLGSFGQGGGLNYTGISVLPTTQGLGGTPAGSSGLGFF